MSIHDQVDISKYLNDIRSFQTYLTHITTSIESGKCNLQIIIKLSDYINRFNKDINEGDVEEEDGVEGEDDGNEENESGDDNSNSTSDNAIENLNVFNNAYFNDSNKSDDSDNDLYGSDLDFDPEHDYTLSYLSSTVKSKIEKIDEDSLRKLMDNDFNVDDVILYQRNGNPISKINNYISNSQYY